MAQLDALTAYRTRFSLDFQAMSRSLPFQTGRVVHCGAGGGCVISLDRLCRDQCDGVQVIEFVPRKLRWAFGLGVEVLLRPRASSVCRNCGSFPDIYAGTQGSESLRSLSHLLIWRQCSFLHKFWALGLPDMWVFLSQRPMFEGRRSGFYEGDWARVYPCL